MRGTLLRILFATVILSPSVLGGPAALDSPEEIAPGQRVLFIAGTNDIHGGFSPTWVDGKALGGAPWLAGYLEALRSHARRRYGDRASVLVLDAGDSSQGTLLSNFSEGVLAVRLMSAMGYTAAIAGNHGFDFGPVGWTDDVVVPGLTDPNPLGALERYTEAAGFSFLGTNVSLRETAEPHPALPPYLLVPIGDGRNAAVFGLESPLTSRLTPPENVATLDFSDGVRELSHHVGRLGSSGEADLFVAVMHEGDGDKEAMKEFLAQLPRRDGGAPLLDAVIAGHTHRVNDAESGGIPYVQSGANGTHFGVIRLVIERAGGTGRYRVLRDRTARRAAIPVDPRAKEFLGEPLAPHRRVAEILDEGEREVAALADRILGVAAAPFTRTGGRIADSEMGNLLADMMRAATGTEIALINSGDVRAGLPAGRVTYEHLFRALPKNLRLVTVSRLPVLPLVRNLERSIRSCGRRGALQVSGLTVEFSRTCELAIDGEDADAKLLKLTTLGGRLLFERRPEGAFVDTEPISMATTDFVLSGGAGYRHFRGVAPDLPTLPLRDIIAERLKALERLDPAQYPQGRYVNTHR